MGTTNKTDVQTDVQNVPVDTMMDQVKLLILCILKWSWGWYKAMMTSQPHHITSDSVCNTLKYMQFCYCYIQSDAQNDVQKRRTLSYYAQFNFLFC